MKRLLRSVRTELRYGLWSKTIYIPLLLMVLALAASFSGSISNVSATEARFHSTESQALANGVTLGQAMEQPNNIVIQGNQRLLDNPLRFDYQSAYDAHRALEGGHVIGTGLEMVTFVVFPLLFFVYGCALAVGDVRRRILKDRVLAQGSWPYVAAKAAVVAVVALGTVTVASILCLLSAPLLRLLFLGNATMDFPYPADGSSVGSPALQIAFSSGTAALFGLLGLFVGLVARTMLIPCLVAGGLLMVAPIVWTYDPRNILSAAGQGVFNFWGGFSPRPAFPVPTEAGLMLLAGGLVLVALGSLAVWSRMTKFV